MAKAGLIALVSTILLNRFAAAEPVRALNTDFPDPSLIQTRDGHYWAFATTGNGVNVQVAYSPDFSTWALLPGLDALPGPFPSWVNSASPATWAPDVIQRDDGTFVMYFSAATSQDPSKHCLGAATSTCITGPYIPEANSLACPLGQGGAIDADGFNDNGTYYVVYKVDGNSLDGDGTTHPTPIMLQELQSDRVTLIGSPIQLLDRDPIDGPDIEAPSLMNVNGMYYLSFSSNKFDTTFYDTSYAIASAVTGPWTKVGSPNAPLLVTGDASNVGPLSGPGGADLSIDGSKIVFHAFENGQNINNGRALYTCGISASGGVITLL